MTDHVADLLSHLNGMVRLMRETNSDPAQIAELLRLIGGLETFCCLTAGAVKLLTNAEVLYEDETAMWYAQRDTVLNTFINTFEETLSTHCCDFTEMKGVH